MRDKVLYIHIHLASRCKKFFSPKQPTTSLRTTQCHVSMESSNISRVFWHTGPKNHIIQTCKAFTNVTHSLDHDMQKHSLPDHLLWRGENMEFTFDFILIRNKFCGKFVIKNISIAFVYHISQLLALTLFLQSACNPSDDLGHDPKSVFENKALKIMFQQNRNYFILYNIILLK